MTTTEAPAIRRGIPLALSTHAAQPETPGALTVMMSVEEARSCVARIRVSFETMRRDLLELEEREGWKALGYDSWRACVQTEFGQSQAYLYRQLTAAKIEREMDSPIGEIPESHLRPLAALDSPEERRAAFDRAAEIAGEGKRTARHVQQAVREIAPPATPPLPSTLARFCTCCGEQWGAQGSVVKGGDFICAMCAGNPDPPAFDDDLEPERGDRWTSTAHKAAEDNDRALLIRAEQEIAIGDYATARGLLNQVGDTSSRARDRLLERLPPAQTAIDLDPLADVLQLMEHVHGSSPHRPTAIRAALELASALASGPLEDWIDQLDDQCYETLACWRRDRSVPA